MVGLLSASLAPDDGSRVALRSVLLTVLVVSTLSSPPANAQSATAPLTLPDALALADSRHETPRIAQARIARAQAARREALSLLFPSLTLLGTYKRAPEVIVDNGGAERFIQRPNALNAQAVLEARVLDLAAFTAYDRVQTQVQAAKIDAQEISRRFSFEVAQSFFTALAAEELVRAAELRQALASAAALDATRRLDAGLADSSTATRAQIESAAAQMAFEEAQGILVVAKAALSSLIGQPVSELAPPEATPLAPTDLTDELLGARPDVQSAVLLQEAAHIATREPWLRLVPALSVRAVTSATNEPGFIGTTNWSVAATLTWALYDGGLRYAQAAARSAELDEAAAGTDLTRRNAALEVQIANARLSATLAAAPPTEMQAELARRNAEETSVRFRLGLATALEQVDASSSAFLAESALARHRLTLRTAQLDLLQALGQWPEASEAQPLRP